MKDGGCRSGATGLCLVALACAACGGSGPADPVEAPPVLEATEDLRIGSAADDEAAFTAFFALDVAPDGRIFTIHRSESRIRIHAPEGTYLGMLGGLGEGPGEMSSPMALGFVGDTTWVLDGSGYRFTYFDPTGLHIGDDRLTMGGGNDFAYPRGRLPDGAAWGSPPVRADDVVSGAVTRTSIVSADPRSGTIDTIARYSLVNSLLGFELPNGGNASMPQPFSDAPIVIVDEYAGKVVLVERPLAGAAGAATFAVVGRSPAGDTLWASEQAYSAIPLDPAAPDSFVARVAANLAEMVPITPEAAADEIRRNLFLPPFYPPVTSVVTGVDGSTWLEIGGPEVTEGAVNERIWRILSESGQAIGEVELPRGFRLFAGAVDAAWGMETDDLDIPYIVRYRIRKTPTDGG